MRSGVPCHVAVVRRAPPPLVSVRHAQHTRRGAQISGTSGGCTRGPGGRGLGTSKPWLLRDSKVSSLVPQSCSSVKPLHTPHALRGFAVCTGGHACMRKASRHDKLDSGCKSPGAVKRAASSTAFAMRAPCPSTVRQHVSTLPHIAKAHALLNPAQNAILSHLALTPATRGSARLRHARRHAERKQRILWAAAQRCAQQAARRIVVAVL